MFKRLREINQKPEPFEFYTAAELWTDEHTAKGMLQCHLNESIDVSSRNKKFIERSVEWIAETFKISPRTAVADFGCGPGLYAYRLAEKGASVTAIDFSVNSLEYARNVAAEKGLEINYEHANYLEFETEKKFDLIIMIMCDFCALSPDQRKLLLSKFRAFLKPGGRVLLDAYTLNMYDLREEATAFEFNHMDGFWSPDDYYCFLKTFKYDEEKVVLDKYTIIEKNRTRVVYNWLQYYSRDALVDEFQDNGFQVEAVYSDVAGKPLSPESTEMAVVAKIN